MKDCDCNAAHTTRRIVLTGGPGAGKTAVLELIRQAFCVHVRVLSEAAGIVFGGGFPREDDPACPACGAIVKSATISFGQMLEPSVIDDAIGLVRSADLLLTVGSSLQVYPAAGLPAEARGHGVRLAIVNDEPTPYDDLADLVVRGRAGEVLGPAVEAALSP